MPIVTAKRISHIALNTHNVEQQTNFYTNIVGLGEAERDSAGRVYLRCNANHHTVVLYPSSEMGIDHYALDVGGPAELEAAAASLSRAGISYETEKPGELGQELSLRLRDPDGYAVELIGGMTQVAPTYGPRAVQPRKLGHVTLLVDDCKRSAEFYSEVLGFRISDWVENGYVLLYGPGRHGPGQNHFEYFRDPEGNLIEFMCDLQQIWDDATYVPRVWNSQERWVNMWGPDGPADFV